MLNLSRRETTNLGNHRAPTIQGFCDSRSPSLRSSSGSNWQLRSRSRCYSSVHKTQPCCLLPRPCVLRPLKHATCSKCFPRGVLHLPHAGQVEERPETTERAEIERDARGEERGTVRPAALAALGLGQGLGLLWLCLSLRVGLGGLIPPGED